MPSFSAGVSAGRRGRRATVNALALAGGRLYAGGIFGLADGVERSDLAAFDAATGAVRDGPAGIDGPVRAIAPAGGRVYVGGGFRHAGTELHPSLLALDAATGGLVGAFNRERPSARQVTVRMPGGGTRRVRRKVILPGLIRDGASVNALVAAGRRLFVGGDGLASVAAVGRGKHRHALRTVIALDAGSGSLIKGFDTPLDEYVDALAATADTVYAGGEFDQQIGTRIVHPRHGKPFKLGIYRTNLIALDAKHGKPVAGFHADVDNTVTTLATDDRTLYVGGDFSRVAGRRRSRLAAVNRVSGTLSTTFTPAPNDAVDAFALAGPRLYVGGAFGAIGATAQQYLAAFTAPGTGPSAP